MGYTLAEADMSFEGPDGETVRDGRSLLERSIQSTQALRLAEKLRQRLKEGDDIRELIVDDFLILYLVRGPQVAFFVHRTSSSAVLCLKGFWRE